MTEGNDPHGRPTQFAREANGRQTGLLKEFAIFLVHTKKWWMSKLSVFSSGAVA